MLVRSHLLIFGEKQYFSAQVIAGFVAACVGALVYYDKFAPWMDKRPVRGTCLFATCPAEAYSNNEVSKNGSKNFKLS